MEYNIAKSVNRFTVLVSKPSFLLRRMKVLIFDFDFGDSPLIFTGKGKKSIRNQLVNYMAHEELIKFFS